MRWVTAHRQQLLIQEKRAAIAWPLRSLGFEESITNRAVHELLFQPAAGGTLPFFPALLEYVPFLDAGAVQQVGVHNLSPGKLSYTPGLGVRVFSPIGPIQLNVGYNPYGGRPGTAYFATPVNTFTNKAPLVCVTAVGEPQVPVFKQQDGQLVQDLTACPSTFRPALSSGFLKHLTFTLSIGTDF